MLCFKIMYNKGIPNTTVVINARVGRCVEICLLKDFINITKDTLPEDTIQRH